ncbi:methylenetetrahydrofolate reductase [Microbulbifer sp.]|uniref:methylenetetrahydrofolate reductase n=1 Tax=Microbulbifer sp. TaxID=1908541 RepID=UPI003F36B6B4
MVSDERDVPAYFEPLEPGFSSPGHFEALLKSGAFAVTAELAPPDSADPEDVFARARVFDGYVDAVNATDGSGANCHMSSVAVCSLLTRVGYSTIMQVSCRDRNRIAIQGDVLGGAAMGVANVLCLTGDGVQVGDHPGAKPVFDLDSTSLLSIVKTMRDRGHFQSGRKIAAPPHLFLGAAANPFAPPFDYRPIQLGKKIAAGAQFIQTQYCFDIARLKNFMDVVCDHGLHEQAFILVGVGPLASARAAEWMRNHVPGVHIPDTVIKRLSGAEDARREGRNICIEMIQQIREIEGVAGVHVMAYRQEEAVAEIIERSEVLRGRTPWYPGAIKNSVTKSVTKEERAMAK